MTPEFIYVDPATKLTRVLQLMVDHRIRSVPVLDCRTATGRDHRARGRHAGAGGEHRARVAAAEGLLSTHHGVNRADQLVFCGIGIVGDFRYTPDMGSTQHRWS